jgi:hypothetical protein
VGFTRQLNVRAWVDEQWQQMRGQLLNSTIVAPLAVASSSVGSWQQQHSFSHGSISSTAAAMMQQRQWQQQNCCSWSRWGHQWGLHDNLMFGRGLTSNGGRQHDSGSVGRSNMGSCRTAQLALAAWQLQNSRIAADLGATAVQQR